jgi:hypothetical protein
MATLEQRLADAIKQKEIALPSQQPSLTEEIKRLRAQIAEGKKFVNSGGYRKSRKSRKSRNRRKSIKRRASV